MSRPAGVEASERLRKRYRWAILVVGTSALGTYSVVRLGLPSLAPELRSSFHLTFGAVGLVLGSIALGQMLTTYTWGWLADVRGERLVLVAGLTGASLAMLGASMASSTVQLAAALFLTGMLGTASVSGSGRAIMAWFAREERGTVLGIRQMAVPLGGAVGAVSLPALTVATSLQVTLLTLSGLMLIGAVMSLVWMRAPPAGRGGAHSAGRSPLADRRMWRLGGAAACKIAGQASVYAFLVLFLHDHHGVSVAGAAACLAVVQVTGALLRVVLGRISDRGGGRVPLIRGMSAMTFMCMAATALLADVPSAALAIALILVTGCLVTSWNGLSTTVAVELSGREQAGKALGMQTTIFSVGSGLMPPVFGLIVQWSSWHVGFGALAALELLAFRWLRPLVEEERHLAAPPGLQEPSTGML